MAGKQSKEVKELDKLTNSVLSKVNLNNSNLRRTIDDFHKNDFPIHGDPLAEWDLNITDGSFASTLRGNAYRVLEWWLELQWPSMHDRDYEEKKSRLYTEQSRLLGISMTMIYCAKKQKVDLMELSNGLNLILQNCRDNPEFQDFNRRERDQLEGKKPAVTGVAGPSLA